MPSYSQLGSSNIDLTFMRFFGTVGSDTGLEDDLGCLERVPLAFPGLEDPEDAG